MREVLFASAILSLLVFCGGCTTNSADTSVDGGARVNDATGGEGSGATGTSGDEPALNPGGDTKPKPNNGDPNE